MFNSIYDHVINTPFTIFFILSILAVSFLFLFYRAAKGDSSTNPNNPKQKKRHPLR